MSQVSYPSSVEAMHTYLYTNQICKPISVRELLLAHSPPMLQLHHCMQSFGFMGPPNISKHGAPPAVPQGLLDGQRAACNGTVNMDTCRTQNPQTLGLLKKPKHVVFEQLPIH